MCKCLLLLLHCLHSRFFITDSSGDSSEGDVSESSFRKAVFRKQFLESEILLIW